MQLFFGWLAWLLTVSGGYLAVLGAVLCLSCGLYYAAELAEEYSVLTGKLLRYATQGVVAGHLLLWLDGFPFGRCVTGILCHGAYAWLLNDYPRLELSSPAFILAILAFLLSHYSWFTFLASGEGARHLAVHELHLLRVAGPLEQHGEGGALLADWHARGGSAEPKRCMANKLV